MRIGELAHAAGCDVQTVRYYEREGLLPRAARGANGYRHYASADAQRLRFVRHCRELGMSLAEIRVLLDYLDRPDQVCAEVNALVDRHVAEIDRQMSALRELKRSLTALRQRCGESRQARDCGILRSLAETRDTFR